MSVTLQIMRLREHGSVLGTRALGADVAREIRSTDANAAALVVDFSGVRVASSPFLDEVACAIRAEIADRPDRYVVLARLNEDVADTLELVLRRRDITLTLLTEKELKVLGGRHQLEETLAAATDLGSFTAPELAERLELKLPNLHQRLVQLEAAGALTRSDDPTATRGRRLLFATPPVDELDAALC
jgi:DNA-binding MarR family transcriptional regulator